MKENGDFSRQFIQFACEEGVIRFGEYQTKAGRLSPYFFNSGFFHEGTSLMRLTQFYADAIIASGIKFDLLFGPAYKGIPLVSGTAIALAQRGRNIPFAFNRKELKHHGEGGMSIGAPLVGNVLIIDDVISAGTSVRESVELIRQAGAQACGVVIALDRMERGAGLLSATQEVEQRHGIPVFAIANLDHLVEFLETSPVSMEQELTDIAQYRQAYGSKASLS